MNVTTTTLGFQKLAGFFYSGLGATYTTTVTPGTGVIENFNVLKRPVSSVTSSIIGNGGASGTVIYTENSDIEFELEVWGNVVTVGTFTIISSSTDTGQGSMLASYATDDNGNVTGFVGSDGGVIGGIIGSSRGSFQLASSVTGGAVTGNSNWRTLISVPEHYDAVRIGLFNIDPTTASSGIKVAIASSDTLKTGSANPQTNGVRDDGRWVNVTFGGSATANLPQTNFPVAQYRVPTITWSDDIPLSSLDRVDVIGAEPLFLVSVFLPAGTVGGLGYPTGLSTASPTYETKTGRVFRTYSQSGSDRTSTPVNWTSDTGEVLSGACIIPAIQFLWRNKVVSTASFGDSTIGGYNSTGGVGWIGQVCNKANNKIINFNMGTSGDTSAVYFVRFLNLIKELNPNICIWQVSTTNDGELTDNIINTQKLIALQVIDICKSLGIRVVLVSPMPSSNSAKTVAVQNRYSSLLNFVNSFSSGTGVMPCDISSLHLTQGQWVVGYNDGDGLHPNDTATSVLVTLLTNSISKSIGVM